MLTSNRPVAFSGCSSRGMHPAHAECVLVCVCHKGKHVTMALNCECSTHIMTWSTDSGRGEITTWCRLV